MATKRDMEQVVFDREQVRIFKRIKEAKPLVDSYLERRSNRSGSH